MKPIILLLLVSGLVIPHTLIAQAPTWSIKEGITTIQLDQQALTDFGVIVDLQNPSDPSLVPGGLGFIAKPSGSATFVVANNQVTLSSNFTLVDVGGFVLSRQGQVLKVNQFVLSVTKGSQALLRLPGSANSLDSALFTLSTTNLSFLDQRNALVVPTTDLLLGERGANVLGLSGFAGRKIGTISIDLTAFPSTEPTTTPPQNVPHTNAPDLTFCSLDSLSQFGRKDDIVGLSISTTSWNIGNQRLDWYRAPDWRHPFIARNMYRLSAQKIEQIGEGWAKHGFYALSDSQCGAPPGTPEGTPCTDPTDGRQLGVNCTDTYNAQTSANQNYLGPRYEINPWTGFWDRTSSHISTPHQHDPVEHRLQVHDADLSLDSNYIVEAYYVHYQDSNVMNSAAWKPVTVATGQPGGTWKFNMTGAGTPPAIGFAIDAWTGSQQTVIAQVNPPLKDTAPDGRCILAVKTQDLGGGKFRYEYALLNIDMDRQVKSFSVPVPTGVNVTELTFHAPDNAGETKSAVNGVATDNSAWTSTHADKSVTWSTSTNPLRWGTLYNFGFTADAPPTNATVTLGLFKTGSPGIVQGESTGPTGLKR